MPVVIANMQEKERASKVKKTYSTLAGAMMRVKADGADMDFVMANRDGEDAIDWFKINLLPYLVYTKVCYNTSGCWNKDDNKYMNGDIVKYNNKGIGIGIGIVTVILNDGTFISVDKYGLGDLKTLFRVNSVTDGLVIFFDINGARKPNIIGKDIFAAVWIPERGLIPAYSDASKELKESDCSKSGTGTSCINKYLIGG